MGCATPPTNETKQISQFKTDFANNLSVVVDYVSNRKRTFIVVDIENPRGEHIDAWLVQKNTTAGHWTSSGKRFYQGDAKIRSFTFRVPVEDIGMTETFIVEVFDSKGATVMVTEPIVNTLAKEETP